MTTYFISGNEPYLIEKKRNSIINESVNRGFECERYSILDFDADQLIALAINPSLFSSNKIVVVEDLEKAGAKELDKIAEALSSPPKGIDVVFLWLGKLKKEKERSSSINKIMGLATVSQENAPYQNQLVSWIITEATHHKKKMLPDAAILLEQEIPHDMRSLQSEIEKCAIYAGERETINRDDVEKLLFQKSAGNIFVFAGAIENRKHLQAMEMMQRLLNSETEPLVILDRAYKTYQRIYKAKLLLKNNLSPREISKKLSLHPYYDAGFFDRIKFFSDSRLKDIFKILAECNLLLKRTDVESDPKYILTDGLLKVFARLKTNSPLTHPVPLRGTPLLIEGN